MLTLHDIPGLDEASSIDFKQRADPQFVLPSSLKHFHKAKARDSKSRKGIKQFIQAGNALPILDHLPSDPDDRTHVALRGDFVLCDLIPLIIARRGHCPHLRIATLGLSADNANTLARLHATHAVREITLVASHYFRGVDKTSTYREVMAILGQRARIIITRCHAKVILIPTEQGDHYVIEGSANLRSSDNLEQIVVFNDQATHDHHSAWIDSLQSHGT